MLTITVPGIEMWDETMEEFVSVEEVVLELEHSLVSLSKWESKHEKAFLGHETKSEEEIMDYVQCMMLGPKVPEEVFSRLSQTNVEEVSEYLNAKMTATWFAEAPGAPRSRDVITAELIYYWMTVFSIPFTCETWHLNRLFTLIRICNVKQAKPKRMPRGEQAARRRELNAQRKAQMGTTG